MQEILSLQNRHWQNQPYSNLLARQSLTRLIKAISLKEVQIVLGVRRAGKSTLFRLLINHLMKEKVNPRAIVNVNLDDPYFSPMWEDAKQLHHILELSERITGIKPQYLFLDEIQNVNNWERFIKSIYDSEILKKIFITGSNSSLLKGQYAKLLSGRYTTEYVYPLSFNEILLANQINDNISLLANKAKVLSLMDEMVYFGSFPEVFKTKDEALKRELLSSYYETILLKDCIANHNIREISTLKHLVNYLLSNNGVLFSYNSLAKAIESNENTIKNFVHIIEDSFLINEVRHFSFSLKAQTKTKRKNYCVDNGLVHITGSNFSKNKGRLFENLVYTELKKGKTRNVYFFNEDNECDFIIQKNGKLTAIQVCYEITSQNKEREIKGLQFVMQKFGITEGYIITFNQEEIIGPNFQIQPFWRFFA